MFKIKSSFSYPIYIAIVITLILSFSTCQEVCPDLEPPTVNNTTTEDTSGVPVRHVIVEEFTGVQCVNCPQGAQAIQALINTYGNRLIAVSVHSGFFSNPLPDSQYDFRTPEGAELETLLGPIIGYPSAVINRKLFPGENSRMLAPGTWAGYIASELELPPSIGMDIVNTYDANSRNLDISITTNFIEEVTDDISLTVIITEDDIIDAQVDNTGLIPMYNHKHVLRKALTNSAGQSIDAQPVGGNTTETFSYTLPPEWNEAKCHVVAFVHQSAPDLEVLQAAEASLIE